MGAPGLDTRHGADAGEPAYGPEGTMGLVTAMPGARRLKPCRVSHRCSGLYGAKEAPSLGAASANGGTAPTCSLKKTNQ